MRGVVAIRSRRLLLLGCLAAVALALAPRRSAAEFARPSLGVPDSVVDGANPGIRVTGLRPNEVIRLHALRSLEKWKESGGQWQRTRQGLHAYADFAASAAGVVDVDTAVPLRGSYARPDPLALLRTGYRIGDPSLKDIRTFAPDSSNLEPQDRVRLALERDGSIATEASFRVVGVPAGLVFAEASGPGWHAVYAHPVSGTNLVPVITLHGSEGGGVAKAHARAAQFAAQGFAALAVNYFAYPHEAIKGVPTSHMDIPIEIVAFARDWLKARPELDMTRLALYGVSKGAEFALLAATRYEWINSVVAVVPSDIVWEGYSADGSPSAARSSWSVGGKPLPFVPLFPFDPKQEGLYRTNTERYSRSRHFHAGRVAAARIPIERARAKILLLASDRDEVWASGEMSRNLVESMTVAGRAAQIEVRIYARAGHQIAGTGTFPIRLYGEQSPDADAKDIVAEGEAAADAWRRTVSFLRK